MLLVSFFDFLSTLYRILSVTIEEKGDTLPSSTFSIQSPGAVFREELFSGFVHLVCMIHTL
jgi:hypothetical protein